MCNHSTWPPWLRSNGSSGACAPPESAEGLLASEKQDPIKDYLRLVHALYFQNVIDVDLVMYKLPLRGHSGIQVVKSQVPEN